MITREEVMRQLDYDEFTGVFTWKVSKGNRVKVGEEAGCVSVFCGKSYRLIRINGKLYLAHRLAWLLLHGEFPAEQIDHIDGNGLTNKAENLRAVSHAENGKNQRKYKTNTSGVTGVYWHKDCSKWYAQICINGKEIYLGYFVDKNEAIKARKAAEMKFGYHGNHGSTRPL